MFFQHNSAWMKEFSNLGLFSDSTQTTLVKLCVITFRTSFAMAPIPVLLAPALFAIQNEEKALELSDVLLIFSCELWLHVSKVFAWISIGDGFSTDSEAIKYITCATCRNVA